MDLSKVSPGRREVLERIALYERERRFDEDVENDPPAPVLLPPRRRGSQLPPRRLYFCLDIT